MKLGAVAYNEQGAYCGSVVGTKAEIRAWLREWYNPEDLDVRITDENNVLIGQKLIGYKRISWEL
jgi:hypothetical protein